MKEPNYYRDRAEQCDRWALAETDPRKKFIWMKLAQSYRQTAARAQIEAEAAWSKKRPPK